jgi:hypothetical protein
MNNPKFVLWCPQHNPTKEQIEELKDYSICFLKETNEKLFEQLSNTPSSGAELRELTKKLIEIFDFYDKVVLPIGSPAFILLLGHSIPNISALKNKILFSHSERHSVDIVQKDGTVLKKSIFKHIKFFNPFVS